MAINLGNILNIGGKTVGSGIISGLDTATLIEGLADAKRIPATLLEDKLEINSTKVTKFGELRTILETFRTSSDFLRSPPGINNASSNIFRFRTVSLLSNTTVDAKTYLSATAAAGAALGNFNVQIGNLAQGKSIRSDSFTSLTSSAVEAALGGTAGLFSAGTFKITGDINTAVGDKLATADYTANAIAGPSVLTTAGVHNIVAPSTGGDQNLQLTGTGNPAFTATYNAGAPDTVDFSVTINGSVYTATGIDADQGSGNQIAAGIITFTNAATGTTFDINLATAQNAANQTEVDTLAASITTDLAAQTIYQVRELGNFTTQSSGIFTGFTRTDALFTSNDFNSDGTHGALEAFSATAATTPGGADGTISVVIDGETYQATGLGNSAIATTATTDTILTADYSVIGTETASGNLTGGIQNIVAPTTGGNINFMGALSGFSGVYNSGDNTVDLSVTINGSTYTAAGLDATQGDGGQLAAGLITFTDSTGTTFDIELSAATDAENQTEIDTLVGQIDAHLATQSVYQSRELGNFDVNDVSGTIAGLASTNVKLTSDGFDITDFTHGVFSNFTVTNNATDDNDISVTINGELYQVLGVANDPGNVTLVNQVDNNKTLQLNFGDAAVTLDIETDFATIEDDLDTAFNVDRHSADITLVNQVDNNKTLQLDIATAGIVLDFTDSANATAVQNALDDLFDVREASVTLNEGDTLNDVAIAINSQKGITGVSANIVQISDTDFRITIQSDKEGTKNTFSIVDSTNVTTDVTFSTLQSAEDSLISIDGTTVKRSTNSINDVITGITFNLTQETPDFGGGSPTIVTVNTKVDTETAYSGIVNFINEFNNFRVFASSQTQRVEGTGAFVEGAVLGSDTLLTTLIRQVNSEVNRTVPGVDNPILNSLASIGITLVDFAGDAENPEVKNILTFDPAVLDDALASNYDDVRQVFEFTFNSSSSKLDIFKRSNSSSLADFKLDIDTSRSNTAGNEIIKVTDLNDVFLFAGTLSNGKITFASGTGLEGTELLYTGDGTDVITVNTSQGAGDRFFNLLNDVVVDGGTLDETVEGLAEEETRLETEIIRIDDQVDRFREALINQFSALEGAIARINTLLDFLDIRSQSIFNSQ